MVVLRKFLIGFGSVVFCGLMLFGAYRLACQPRFDPQAPCDSCGAQVYPVVYGLREPDDVAEYVSASNGWILPKTPTREVVILGSGCTGAGRGPEWICEACGRMWPGMEKAVGPLKRFVRLFVEEL